MYSEQLETLIKNVLADGVITDKERAVLHKKAEAEGIDVDEIDVYIDGELDKTRSEQMKAKVQVRKCPACGEIIPALTSICPSCGASIKDGDLREFVRKIEEEIVRINSISFGMDFEVADYIEKKSVFEKDIRIGRTLYGDNSKIACLINELQDELMIKDEKFAIWKKKKGLIKLIKLPISFLPVIAYVFYYIYKYQMTSPNIGHIYFGFCILCISWWLSRKMETFLNFLILR
jgi:hypothetical protein